MAAVLMNPGSSSGPGLFRIGIQVTEKLYRLSFKTGHWNAIIRHGLHVAGLHYIRVDLEKRFTSFARDELGYDGKGDHTSPLAKAKASGLVDSLAQKFWGGWNPWVVPHVPYALWAKHLAEEKAAGRFHKSNSGYFTTEKRKLRKRVKEDLKRRVLELSTEGEKNEKLPLVETGDLRRVALAGARAHATATRSTQKVRIVIPQPHGTHAIVGAVLKRLTTGELAELGEVLNKDVAASIAGAALTVKPATKKRPQMVRRRLSSQQLSALQSVNQHRSRQQRHRSRRPTAA